MEFFHKIKVLTENTIDYDVTFGVSTELRSCAGLQTTKTKDMLKILMNSIRYFEFRGEKTW